MATAAGAVVPLPSILVRKAVGQILQGTQLPGSAIPQFVDPLPALQLLDGTAGPILLTMEEFRSPVMPSTFVPAAGAYGGGTPSRPPTPWERPPPRSAPMLRPLWSC